MTTNPEDTTTSYRITYIILGLIHSNFIGLEIGIKFGKSRSGEGRHAHFRKLLENEINLEPID
jgi:hypothetical protein